MAAVCCFVVKHKGKWLLTVFLVTIQRYTACTTCSRCSYLTTYLPSLAKVALSEVLLARTEVTRD